MARPSNPLSRQLACLTLVVLGILYSTKAEFSLDPASNDIPSISSTASQKDKTISYTVHTEELTWEEARQKCIEDGARLAVIDTYDKVRLVGDLKPFDCYVWVGITRVGPSAAWVKAHDGSPVTMIPWAPMQSNGSHNCLTVQGCNRGLGTEDCTTQKGFVCENSEETCPMYGSMSLQEICQLIAPAAPIPEENDTDEVPTTTASPTTETITVSPPGPQWKRFNDSPVYYNFYHDDATWKEAKRLCENEGARLATADSQEVYQHFLTNCAYDRIHIGIHRVNGEWVSLRNGSSVSNLQWASGQPDNSLDCVTIHDGDGLLHTEDCDTSKTHYACEVPIA